MMEEENNVLRILESALDAIKKGDSVKIKNLSNQTINTASLTHDPDNIAVAVIIYSLSKIVEGEHYKKCKGWGNFYKNILVFLKNSVIAVKKKDEKELKLNLGFIRKEINKLSGKLKKYIQDVFHKAKINKASRIYEHGISMEKTAKLLGISLWELANYAGQTEISEMPENKTIDTKSRIKLAMEMFE